MPRVKRSTKRSDRRKKILKGLADPLAAYRHVPFLAHNMAVRGEQSGDRLRVSRVIGFDELGNVGSDSCFVGRAVRLFGQGGDGLDVLGERGLHVFEQHRCWFSR